VIASVPHLYAIAHGQACAGPCRCLYCGAPCDDTRPASTYVKDSFTGRPGVVAPASPYVCAGCVLCLREDATITLLDGEVRDGQKVRGYSWVVTATEALAATKAHLDRLRALCLDPPEPPCAIVLSDSGQTHQLYRGVVCRSRELLAVTLEAEPVTYRRGQLVAALGLASRIAAATGKPALREPLSYAGAMRVMAHHGDGAETLIDDWQAVQGSPLGRLASWLCANKEACLNEHPSATAPDTGHRGVPPQAGGAGRPERQGGGARPGGRARDGQPLLFDPRPSFL